MLNLMLSVAALTLLSSLALVAIFYEHYHDNWLQFLGLWGIVIAGGAKVAQILDRDYSSSENTMLYGALACFAFGTALKVRKFRRRNGGRVRS